MKRLFALLILLPALAFGGPNDIVATQRNSADTGLAPARLVTAPMGGASAIMGYNGATQLPIHWSVGSGIGIVSGALVALPQDWSAITGKPTLFSGSYSALTGVPATFAPSAHTQAWSTITSTPTTMAGYGISDGVSSSALANYATTASLTAGLSTKLNTPAGTTAQYVRGDGSLATLPVAQAVSINDTPGRSLVTAATATGFQVSATRVSKVCYEGSFSTTSTIGGPSSASVFLETADTNSTTAGDWTIKAQQTYTNTITLAVVLNQVQGNNWSICRYIPAGKYVRIRSGSITGTASATINATQQETLL